MKTLLYFLFVISLSVSLFAQKIGYDFVFHISNNNLQEQITVKLTRQNNTNCYDKYFNITQRYSNPTHIGTGDIGFYICWKDSVDTNSIALGIYKVKISTNSYPKDSFNLDLRSKTCLNWNDVHIYYNCSDGNLTWNGSTLSNNSTHSWWEMNPSLGYSPIIRQVATSGYPHIVWDQVSDRSLGDYYIIDYKVYRGTTLLTTISPDTYEFYDYDYTISGGPWSASYQVSAYYSNIPMKDNNYMECEKSNQVEAHNLWLVKRAGTSTQPGDYFLTNYPNPFNPNTKISFTMPETSNLELSVYNAFGQEVQQLFRGLKEKGNHEFNFDGKNLSSGVYYYTIKTDKFTQTKKMILIK